jgi:hypothetical protein
MPLLLENVQEYIDPLEDLNSVNYLLSMWCQIQLNE